MAFAYKDRKALLDAIINRIENGESLKSAAKAEGQTPQDINKYLRNDKEAALAYDRAKELRADLLADEIIEIADLESDAAKARNRIDARKWIASKHYSKRYGDRIDLNVSMQIDIAATLEEARGRLLPISDQSNIIDAQAIDISNTIAPCASDTLSVAQETKAPQPKIFDE